MHKNATVFCMHQTNNYIVSYNLGNTIQYNTLRYIYAAAAPHAPALSRISVLKNLN